MKLCMIGTTLEHRPTMLRRRKGLTLVEILVVVLIIAVLMALTVTVFKRARTASRSTACMSNVKQVGMALLAHAGDNNNNKFIPLQPAENPKTGKRPPVWTVQLAQAGYLTQWDATANARNPNKGWYAIWSKPARWSDHGPAARSMIYRFGSAARCRLAGAAWKPGSPSETPPERKIAHRPKFRIDSLRIQG